MRTQLIKLILLTCLLIPEITIAQSVRGELRSQFRHATKALTFTLGTNNSAKGCRVDIYGSASRARLERNPTRGKKLVSFVARRRTNRVKALEVADLAGNGSPKQIYFRAGLKCKSGSGRSNLTSLRFPTAAISALKASSWFEDLRQKFVSKTLTFERAFPNLTFNSPVDFQSPKDGGNRIFIVEQAGLIKVFQNTNPVLTQSTYLDISSKVKSGGEQGLLGLAFHPDYVDNGFFYVNYTRVPDGATVIARYRVTESNTNAADPASEVVLLVIEQPFDNHNGGAIAFGKDGYLYITSGDGGSGGDPQGNAQRLDSLLGKILRIDVNSTSAGNYGIPSDNPFAGNPSGAREEIFAYGFRNPWRLSIDSSTGEVWVGDVGQGAKEEVDIVTKGGNYGWNITEGSNCYNSTNCDQSALIAPVAEYGRDVGQSITGGYVYRGLATPNLLGSYVFADFVTGRLFSLTRIGSEVSVAQLFNTDLNISSFGVDRDGELYFLSYSNGTLHRFK